MTTGPDCIATAPDNSAAGDRGHDPKSWDYTRQAVSSQTRRPGHRSRPNTAMRGHDPSMRTRSFPSRPALLYGFLASTALDLTSFGNPHD